MRVFILAIICILFISCGSGSGTSGNKVQKPVNNKNEVFDVFFKMFDSDSTIQASRIKYPLKVVLRYEEGDTIKVIRRGDWKYFPLSKIKNGIISKDSVKANKINLISQIGDTGVQVTYFFVKEKGRWWLNSIVDDGD
jgi:hypothetical protein